ncbi:hypothetical protein FHG87_016680 [Trinorchestia longiramus]|nr:hypothetical protein FHG87_016680 [Trinorchestia longiramus]
MDQSRFVAIRVARTTYEHSTDEASYRRPIREQDNGSESSDEARPRYDWKHAKAAEPSQLPNIRRLICSVSHGIERIINRNERHAGRKLR